MRSRAKLIASPFYQSSKRGKLYQLAYYLGGRRVLRNFADKSQAKRKGNQFCEAFKWEANGLRHSFISYRLAILHDTARVALEAGNSPEVIFGHLPRTGYAGSSNRLVLREAAT
jgi:hypothetical protein